MNGRNHSEDSSSDLLSDTSERTEDNTVWQLELMQLIEQQLDCESVYQFLVSLAHLIVEWRRIRISKRTHERIGIEPTIGNLTIELNKELRFLKDNVEKYFLKQFIDEALKLLISEKEALVREFRYESLNYLTTYLNRDENMCTPLIRVVTSDISYATALLPVRVTVFGSDGNKITNNSDSLARDEQEYTSEEKMQELQLSADELASLSVRLLGVKYASFVNCYSLLLVDVSHTCIRHLDTRELIELKELKLTNTNIMRINIINLRHLRILYCNYTLINYLQLSECLLLKILYIEYSGQKKLNQVDKCSMIIIDDGQVINEYYCRNKIVKKIEEHIISYHPGGHNEDDIVITVPELYHEFIDWGIRQCKSLGINGYCTYCLKTQSELHIVGYPNLEVVNIWGIEFCRIYIANHPLLISVGIRDTRVLSVVFFQLDNLEEIEIVDAKLMKEINIIRCKKLKILNVYGTSVDELDIKECVELIKLGMCNSDITEINVTKNIKLEELDVSGTKIFSLDVSELTELKNLNVSNTNITQLNLSANTKLESLNMDNTTIPELDVSSNVVLKELSAFKAEHLIVLNISNTNIIELDLSGHTRLAALNISRTRELRVLNISNTSIIEIDVSKNIKLEELKISNTRISQLDISELKFLRVLSAYRTTIRWIDVFFNTELRILEVFNTKLMQIDISQNYLLETLSINGTKISELDVRHLKELKVLYIYNTAITEIDVSHNTNLEELGVYDTNLSQLDVSELTELKKLDVSNTNIAELDVSRNTKLEDLQVENTKISELNVRTLTELVWLQADNENIRQIDLLYNLKLTYVCVSCKCEVLCCCCSVDFRD